MLLAPPSLKTRNGCCDIDKFLSRTLLSQTCYPFKHSNVIRRGDRLQRSAHHSPPILPLFPHCFSHLVHIHPFWQKKQPPLNTQPERPEPAYLANPLTSASSPNNSSNLSLPNACSILACASCHSGHALLRASSPSSVNVTTLVRRSSPSSLLTRCSFPRTPRLRVSVVRSMSIISASPFIVTGPASAMVASSPNCGAYNPLGASISS